MSRSDDLRKYTLECMRLEGEALQMARDVESPALKSHFARIAKQWLEQAEHGPRLN